MSQSHFQNVAKDIFGFLIGDHGYSEFALDYNKYGSEYCYCLKNGEVWILIEGTGFGTDATIQIARHDLNQVARWPHSALSLEGILRERCPGFRQLESRDTNNIQIQKMQHLSDALKAYGKDIITGDLSALPVQVYVLEHYEDGENLNNAINNLNPVGRRFIGVFTSHEKANMTIKDRMQKIGFQKKPNNFVVSVYPLDMGFWMCGYGTVRPNA